MGSENEATANVPTKQNANWLIWIPAGAWLHFISSLVPGSFYNFRGHGQGNQQPFREPWNMKNSTSQPSNKANTRPRSWKGTPRSPPRNLQNLNSCRSGFDATSNGANMMIRYQCLSLFPKCSDKPSTSVTSVFIHPQKYPCMDQIIVSKQWIYHLSACKALCLQSLLPQPVWEIVGWRPTSQHLPNSHSSQMVQSTNLQCLSLCSAVLQDRVHSSGFKVPYRYVVDRWMDTCICGYMDTLIDKWISGQMD